VPALHSVLFNSLRCWYLLFKVKSGSRNISILLFSRIFVYRCHGNIDFHKMQTTLKFNPVQSQFFNFSVVCFQPLLKSPTSPLPFHKIDYKTNHSKVQSKTNKYCKFHVDLTRRTLSKSRF